MEETYFVIDSSGVIVNAIVYDGVATYDHTGLTVKKASECVEGVDYTDGGGFV